MRHTKKQDTKEQIEFLINEQILILRERDRSCARIFNHKTWDDCMARYYKLEAQIKALSIVETSPANNDFSTTSPDSEVVPPEMETGTIISQ